MPINTADNKFGVAKWIVNPTAGLGTHTTITSALASSSSGDTIFIMPGTYTENFTLIAGVNLTAFACDSNTPNVKIIGTMSYAAAAAVTITFSGIYFQNTGATNILSFTGNASTVLNFYDCYFNAATNSALAISASSTGVNFYNCVMIVGNASYAMFVKSGNGTINCFYCTQSGSASTSTCSAGTINFYYCISNALFSTSSTGAINFYNCIIGDSANNATVLTTAGTGTCIGSSSRFISGTASAVSIGSGTTFNNNCSQFDSTNTNVLTGAGTLNQTPQVVTNTGFGNNVTTQVDYAFGRTATFTPVVTFGGGSTGITYTTAPSLKYWRVGQMIYFNMSFLMSSKGSSTGAFQVTVPFTSANDSSAGFNIPINFSGTGVTFPTLTTEVFGGIAPNNAFMTASGIGATGTLTALTDAHFSNTAFFSASGFYWTA